MNSIILNEIRKVMIGTDDDTGFDTDLIIYINSALSRLYQLGIGVRNFKITPNGNETWGAFLNNDESLLSYTKDAVIKSVRLAFDPPANSYTVSLMKDSLAELQWCAGVDAEFPDEE